MEMNESTRHSESVASTEATGTGSCSSDAQKSNTRSPIQVEESPSSNGPRLDEKQLQETVQNSPVVSPKSNESQMSSDRKESPKNLNSVTTGSAHANSHDDGNGAAENAKTNFRDDQNQEQQVATDDEIHKSEKDNTTPSHMMMMLKDEEDIMRKSSNDAGDRDGGAGDEENSSNEGSQMQPPTATTDNVCSSPKSETQTDETNTGTGTLSSPASDTVLSPVADVESSAPTMVPLTTTTIVDIGKLSQTSNSSPEACGSQLINVRANGIIPNSGKPFMLAMNKRHNKSSPRSMRQRKAKPMVAMYESEISDNKIGIKLCIKKSDAISTAVAALVTPSPMLETVPLETIAATTPTKALAPKTSTRKRSRKSKTRRRFESDDSEYEMKRKRLGAANNNATADQQQHPQQQQRQRKVAFAACIVGEKEAIERVEQSDWGGRMPEEVLYNIFKVVVDEEGCLPTLFRLGRVCSLWRRVSLFPMLWRSLDVSTRVKEKHRTELKLKWFVENRCHSCTDLNVSHWKVADINCFLGKLANSCPSLTSISLSGWKGFTSDHLTFLVENMKKLERLDLSSINVEMNTSKSAVGLQSLCNSLQTLNVRLTHLYLAHNRLAGIPQMVNILSIHCPNLILLDLSNVCTQATSHGILHVEKLQHGCKKLKVLRITNSHVSLSTATMQETMDSPGFPDLEELSVAALIAESRIMCDEHLQRILKTSSKLKLLDVRGCTRLTHESLIRLPAWDIKHLFLSGCSVTRDVGSGLELIASKWAHSLIELDLAWANVQKPLDNALRSLAEKGSESPLAHLNLCGSSVSDDAVKDILANCAHMSSINLSSCRGLPRGVKRLMQGTNELQELRDVLKVTMKVKLPSQIKKEEDASAAAVAATTTTATVIAMTTATTTTTSSSLSTSLSSSSSSPPPPAPPSSSASSSSPPAPPLKVTKTETSASMTAENDDDMDAPNATIDDGVDGIKH